MSDRTSVNTELLQALMGATVIAKHQWCPETCRAMLQAAMNLTESLAGKDEERWAIAKSRASKVPSHTEGR